MKVRGITPGRSGVALGVERIDVDLALPDLQRRFDAFDHARLVGRRHAQPVLHDLEHVAAARVDAVVALGLEERVHFLLLEILRHRHGEGEHQSRIARGLGAGRQLLVYR